MMTMKNACLLYNTLAGETFAKHETPVSGVMLALDIPQMLPDWTHLDDPEVQKAHAKAATFLREWANALEFGK